jgi:hypothetical protein
VPEDLLLQPEEGPEPSESVTQQNLRRELGWKPPEGDFSLAAVSEEFGDFLFVNYYSSPSEILQRLRAPNPQKAVHRCPGYEREEITLSTSINNSVVISHTMPSLREICIVCRKPVQELNFRCVCGEGELNDIVVMFLSADLSNRGQWLQTYH